MIYQIDSKGVQRTERKEETKQESVSMGRKVRGGRYGLSFSYVSTIALIDSQMLWNHSRM